MHILAGMLAAILGAATPAPVEVHVSLSPPIIPVYRQAVFTITADVREGLEVVLPDMKDKFGGADVYGEPKQTVVRLSDGRLRTQVRYVLDAPKAGLYAIEPVEVEWGQSGGLTAPAPVLQVRELTAEEEMSLSQFEPIALPAARRPFLQSWMGWTAMGLSLGGVALALAYALLRRRGLLEQASAPRMPWETARERLLALEARGLAEAGAWEPFYVELSDILRHYVEDRFHLHAPERTTPEFLSEAGNTGVFNPDHERLLTSVLRHADRVKFAREEPTAEQMERDFGAVGQFVDETIPRLAVPANGEAAA